MSTSRAAGLIAGCWLLLVPLAAVSGAEPAGDGDEDARARLNLNSPTLGGVQFWTDELIFRDWRIQRNAVSGHYRLLDEGNRRHAWGTFEQCRRALDDLKQSQSLPPVTGPVVLVLHGLGRSRMSTAGLAGYLQQPGDWLVLTMGYASTRDGLDGHARALSRVLEHLDPQVTRVHFVAHSLGNLVIRRYLAGCERQEDGFRPEPRMGRIVMLGPPNQGAHLAKLFQDNPAVRWIGGDSIRDLAQRQQWLRENLATPRGEFGILAGCVAESIGGNRLLEGDDDLVVSVEETKLAGASDFAVLPVVHTVLMDDPRARERTLRFLQRGYFVSPDRRQPLLPGPTPDDRSREGGEADP